MVNCHPVNKRDKIVNLVGENDEGTGVGGGKDGKASGEEKRDVGREEDGNWTSIPDVQIKKCITAAGRVVVKENQLGRGGG